MSKVTKSVLLLPIIFDDNLTVTSIKFFVAYFNILSCKFDNFTFTFYNTFAVPSRKSGIVFFDVFDDEEHCCIPSNIIDFL